VTGFISGSICAPAIFTLVIGPSCGVSTASSDSSMRKCIRSLVLHILSGCLTCTGYPKPNLILEFVFDAPTCQTGAGYIRSQDAEIVYPKRAAVKANCLGSVAQGACSHSHSSGRSKIESVALDFRYFDAHVLTTA